MPQAHVTGPSFGNIIGMEDAKTAMMCMAVDPSIRSLLIRGPSGVGKSVLIESFTSEVFGRMPVKLPVSSSDDQVFGTLDIESAISGNGIKFSKGILAKAEGGAVVIDDINLFDRRFAHVLMNSIVSGHVMVEREGFSSEYDCSVSVIATANIQGTVLDSGVSDLFDMSVTVDTSEDVDYRISVINANEYSEDIESDGTTRKKVESARIILPDVIMTEDQVRSIAEVSVKYRVQGHRGDLAAIRVCKALAALGGRKQVSDEDVKKAVLLCLNHRRTLKHETVTDNRESYEVSLYNNKRLSNMLRRQASVSEQLEAAEASEAEKKNVIDESELPEGEIAEAADDEDEEIDNVLFGIGEMFESMDLLEENRKRMEILDNQAKRKSIKDDGAEGRCVSSRQMPEDECSNLAIDATIRAAAPYQIQRRESPEDRNIILRKYDFRQKVYERHTACVFLFLIDTSGSLIIRRRMRNVKSAIMSILSDHYVRRDRVAIGTFNQENIGLIQTPTRSVGSIKGVLEQISVGTKTPLSSALVFGSDFAKEHERKHKGEKVFIILMTDGEGNLPLNEGRDPIEESLEIASVLSKEDVVWTVVDTGTKHAEKQYAYKLSQALGASFYKLDELKSSVE